VRRLVGLAACLGMVLVIGACTDDPATPRPPYDLPEPSSPANVLLALERIYEDAEIDPAEQARGFATLLAPPPGNQDLPAFKREFANPLRPRALGSRGLHPEATWSTR
jgi:hypothetical protein